MLIVDGQIHLWEKGTPSPPRDPDSNELAVEAARKYPDRFAIMGWFYLDDPNGPDLVAHWKERSGMFGQRAAQAGMDD